MSTNIFQKNENFPVASKADQAFIDGSPGAGQSGVLNLGRWGPLGNTRLRERGRFAYRSVGISLRRAFPKAEKYWGYKGAKNGQDAGHASQR